MLPFSFLSMIELQGLAAVPRRVGEVHALRDVSLSIAAGEIFGIIGRSGAGKSTLVRAINLLNRPTSGRVIVDGQDLTALDKARCARRAARSA
jgi:D-methionine transport system ATP-binding protein